MEGRGGGVWHGTGKRKVRRGNDWRLPRDCVTAMIKKRPRREKQESRDGSYKMEEGMGWW